MEYGLIGNPLKHSFSKEIHSQIADYNYELCELDDNSFNDFLKNKNFKAINVTIPYKQKIIPFLDYIDDDAKNINAVNTIININKKLYGFNTDILGVIATFNNYKIDVQNKNVLILGTGATSNTVYHACVKSKAKKIFKAYRNESKNKGDILYNDIYKLYDNIHIIINTTSNGMFPHSDDQLLVDVKKFRNLKVVIDVVYNPLKTKLLLEANENNIKSISGLYMLISQAVFASKLFLNHNEYKSTNDIKNSNTYVDTLNNINEIYKKSLIDKQNVVLIGMPTCGKSSLGKLLCEKLNYEFIDTDKLIEEKIGLKISNFITLNGEKKFRDLESEIIAQISSKNHSVISTGGGAILKSENISKLKQNGKLFFINRSLNLLKATADRPLTSDIESLTKIYNERLPIYKKSADIIINGDLEFDDKIKEIMNNL